MAVAGLNCRQRSFFRAALYALVCTVISAGVWAQDTTMVTVQHGPSNYETTVKSGTVTWVSWQ